jgi:hypothetical protein
MGLLKRKSTEKEETPVAPTRLKVMTGEDVYLLVESSLMSAQHQLSSYRKALPSDKIALLKWIESNISAASLGTQELMSRNFPEQVDI